MNEQQTQYGFGCKFCFSEDPQIAWLAVHRHRNIRHQLIDTSHFSVLLYQCPFCHQDFVHIFTEFINWDGDGDSLYWDAMPLTPAEAEAFVAQGAKVDLKQLENISDQRRRLKMNWATSQSQQLMWASDKLFIMPGF